MTIRSSIRGSVRHLVVDCGDALDAQNADAVKQAALEVLDGTRDVVLDLEHVELVDSRGLGVLVSLQKAVRASGRRANFTGVGPEVRRVLELVRLDRIFEVHESIEEATRALNERRDQRRRLRCTT